MDNISGILIHSQRKRTLIFLLGIILLAGQFASLSHTTSHPFHVTDNYCLSLSALEHSANALFIDIPQLLAVIFYCVYSTLPQSESITQTSARYQARAPPQS